MTAGWLAFDEPTRRRLREIAANPVDIHGDAIELATKDEPILACVSQRPMRAPQIAARLRMRRWELAIAIEAMLVRGVICRDAEAFIDLVRH